MRSVGTVADMNQATTLVRYLRSQNIGCEARDMGDGEPVKIWIHDEDQLDQAKSILEQFAAKPDDAQFKVRGGAAKSEPNIPKWAQAGGDRHRHVDVRSQMFGRAMGAPITVTMIVICAALFFLERILPNAADLIYPLMYSEYAYPRDFREILSGQIWRLVTPAFLHGNMLHILFNMYWLYQLGGMIERTEGKKTIILHVLAFAALSNTAQYINAGPNFVGMSGVIYALVGYLWMMTRFDPYGRYRLDQSVVIIMVIWMVVCIMGFVPRVANTAHVGGFIVGVIWGYLWSSGFKSYMRKREWRKKNE